MSRITALCAVVVIGVCQSSFGEEISSEAIQQGKDATALVVTGRGRAFGSAFCVDASGYFLTNEHVVKRAQSCELVLQPGTSAEKKVTASVVRTDDKADLALLKTSGPVDIPALALERASDLKEADQLATFGYPLGIALSLEKNRAPSVSVHLGRVTAVRRIDGVVESIQLDAQVNPGNSGGPVLNTRGLVIGIVQAKIVGTGLNFAIPVGRVEQFLKSPAVAVEFPKVLSEGEAADFAVDVTSILRNLERPEVEIEVATATGAMRTEPLPSTNGKRFASRLILVPKTSELPQVGIEARFGGDGLIRGATANARITVGDHTHSLSEVSTIEREGKQFKVTLRDGRTMTGAEITGLPDSVQLERLAVQAALSKAASISIRLQLPDVVQYTVRVKDERQLISEQTGRIPIQGRSPQPEKTPSAPAPSGTWTKLGESPALPSYLTSTGSLKRTQDQGVRFLEERTAIQSIDRTLLSKDFVFEALITFEFDDRIGYIGIGPGIEDRSYNGLTDSLYLRLHQHTLANGLVGMQNWNRGMTSLGKIDHPGIHRVRIEKQGDAVTFHVDPDNDGPSADDIEVTYPNVRALAPYLTAKNSSVFLTGSGTFLSTRLEIR